MALSIAEADLDRLLDPIRTGLEADGYRLSAHLTDQAVRIDVEATPQACAECLVPKKIMETMVRHALGRQEGAGDVPIEIGYPTD